MKVLINDGISVSGEKVLKQAGFQVYTTTVAQEQLASYINEHDIAVLLVRSATKVREDIIQGCPGLRLIGRGGVGLDNIDLALAERKGISVVNTPAASSDSVAELVFAHLLGGLRFLQEANRTMPLEGDQHFKRLKKAYSNGSELRGKTLGLLGFGKIGQATAKLALGMGMHVLFYDPKVKEAPLKLSFYDGQTVGFHLKGSAKEKVLRESDFVSLHIPGQKGYVMGAPEFEMMKDGAAVINTARGGVLDEVALVKALESGKLAFAGLDVFESEPHPEIPILMNPAISLSPHIGAGTKEAQERIGLELAQQVIRELK